jgi:hypothetical protein
MNQNTNESKIMDVQIAIISLQEENKEVSVAAISEITGIPKSQLYNFQEVKPFVRSHSANGTSKSRAANDYALWKADQKAKADQEAFERHVVQQELLEMEHNAKIKREKAADLEIGRMLFSQEGKSSFQPFNPTSLPTLRGNTQSIILTIQDNQVVDISECNKGDLRQHTDRLMSLYPGADLKVYDEGFTIKVLPRAN